MTSLGRQTKQVKILQLEKRQRKEGNTEISKNHQITWREWLGDGYSLLLRGKGRREHVVKLWSNIFETNNRIRCCLVELWRFEVGKGGGWRAVTPMLVRTQVSCPAELLPRAEQLQQSAGSACDGVLLSFSSGEWEMGPLESQTDPQISVCWFCSGDFVTGLEGKSLTLG